MSIRTIAIAALLLSALVIGNLQKVTLPSWAWIVWAALLLIAIGAWIVVSRTVSWAVRKAILMVPVSGRSAPGGGNLSIPVAEIHNSAARFEAEISRMMRFRPLQWLAIRAFRGKMAGFLDGMVEHCKANRSEVLDAPLFATWIHGKVAATLGASAGEIVSGFWQILVIVIASVGLFFATASFR